MFFGLVCTLCCAPSLVDVDARVDTQFVECLCSSDQCAHSVAPFTSDECVRDCASFDHHSCSLDLSAVSNALSACGVRALGAAYCTEHLCPAGSGVPNVAPPGNVMEVDTCSADVFNTPEQCMRLSTLNIDSGKRKATPDAAGTPVAISEPPKKRRERPRRITFDVANVNKSSERNEVDTESSIMPPPCGRPPKQKPGEEANEVIHLWSLSKDIRRIRTLLR